MCLQINIKILYIDSLNRIIVIATKTSEWPLSYPAITNRGIENRRCTKSVADLELNFGKWLT